LITKTLASTDLDCGSVVFDYNYQYGEDYHVASYLFSTVRPVAGTSFSINA
jgi:hypothetical protein